MKFNAGFSLVIIKNIRNLIIPTVIFLLALEVAARCLFYQRNSNQTFALSRGIDRLTTYMVERRARARIREVTDFLKGSQIQELGAKELKKLFNDLFDQKNSRLLAYFMADYEKYFRRFVQISQSIKAKTALLYIPSPLIHSGGEKEKMKFYSRLKTCREFYSAIAKKYNIDMIDVTEKMMKYDISFVTLAPEDEHPSRFGNIIISDAVYQYLKINSDYKSLFSFGSKKPARLGDLSSDVRQRREDKNISYMVITNSDGFRMNHNLDTAKDKQRVLMLGDSFTFGGLLNNADTFPSILQRRLPETEIINAGIGGYTITDEVSYLNEKGKYTEPDIIILQVHDNDLFGLLFFLKNIFDRNRHIYEPLQQEINFIKDSLGNQ